MNHKDYISFLNTVEKLKCNTRHSWTTNGRQESVADHCWRLALMAMLCSDEYPDVNIDRGIKMSLIHDLGEAVTGDIPAFEKTEEDEITEDKAIDSLLSMLPDGIRREFSLLYKEIKELSTPEAKLFKALDNMEALISHNESDISTWLPIEYTENLVYGQKNVEWSDWTRKLKDEIKEQSIKKMSEANSGT